MRMLGIDNAADEGWFGGLRAWIPAVSGRLTGLDFDQRNPSWRASNRPHKGPNEREIEIQGIALHWPSRESDLEVGSQ